MNKLISVLKSVWNYFIYLLYPPHCPSCDKVTGYRIEGEMCSECHKAFIDEFVTVCPKCGLKAELCECSTDSLGGDSDRSPYTTMHPIIFSGYYVGYNDDSVVGSLVFRMKRDEESSAKYVFARMIAQCLSRYCVLNKIDLTDFVLTYIPRSKDSIEKYEFDHMKYVSKIVSKMLGCKCGSYFIRKGGTAQKELSYEERIKNARLSIHLNPKKVAHIRGTKFIVIDDIITTGSTMATAISKLSFAGADVIIPAAAMISKTFKKAD